MSVLIYIDQTEGSIKKASFETLSYGAAVAKQMNLPAYGIVLGKINDNNLAALGKYGISKVYHITDEVYNHLDTQTYTRAIADIATETGATIVVFSYNQTGKAIAPRVAVRLKAGIVTGAIELPDTSNGFVVKKNTFSGKAFAFVKINTAIKVISLNLNAFGVIAGDGEAEVIDKSIPATSKVKVVAIHKVSGEVPLTEADIVVSGGRGMKGPEHWGILEDLAKELHAATACSRPVSDADWRPHHEHVGQTGIQVSPNLYFAIGISGAIQHLAGVNRSKTIVVINKDAEAPFFKVADYGIVGDAFEVLPKLTQAIKDLKG